ncbi:RES family NAD+ phosphorylase [Variovorax ginsengisoli]|uniref:RES family NAD+ phosphorylase n=1 Tax=Variovorax ginsengisoli TaxID=363844 RepID=A0ABT8SAC2_9BURK|nr:RES family NAD+ phosphorylase [Variovorax ginsengisoli]MDN8616578.1 RES family NAD+ phosphorylase [Variovorax ginsengisoli]MDO1535748.1 RES family NAD+ phosphorylase [Variovorax ginsengisoli]
MKLWRIAADTRKYRADDLSGAGAAKNPGRWNDAGEPVLYTAPTISLAVLETAAHIDDGGLPLNRYLLELDVPGGVWARREEIDIATLPPTWSAIPAGRASVKLGSTWLASLRSPILLVPSVVVPEERAALVNPSHPQCHRITCRVIRAFEYNRLFRS